ESPAQEPERNPVDGGLEIERCASCGLPVGLRGFVWDELYGVIREGPRGKRNVFIPSFIISVMEDLENRDGVHILEREAYDYAMESLRRDGKDRTASKQESIDIGVIDDPGDFLERVGLWGWGYVEKAALEGSSWKVTVSNPLLVALIAGWLGALYTITMGREPLIEEFKEEGRANFFLE
ncbi:MAG: hypothetical protein ACOC78_03105, partial [Actinomycetota bacterium]